MTLNKTLGNQQIIKDLRLMDNTMISRRKRWKGDRRTISRPGVIWTSLIQAYELINSANSTILTLQLLVNAGKCVKEDGRGWEANRREVSSHNSRLHASAKLPFDLFASRKRWVTSVALAVGRSLLASVFSLRLRSIDRWKWRVDTRLCICENL